MKLMLLYKILIHSNTIDVIGRCIDFSRLVFQQKIKSLQKKEKKENPTENLLFSLCIYNAQGGCE